MPTITSLTPVTRWPGGGLMDANGTLSHVIIEGDGLDKLYVKLYQSDGTGSKWLGQLAVSTANAAMFWTDLDCKNTPGPHLDAASGVGDGPDVAVTVDVGTDPDVT